jgi:glyoxylase-like metal-dependent hydrolase (beta-lactamase superfamily II)
MHGLSPDDDRRRLVSDVFWTDPASLVRSATVGSFQVTQLPDGVLDESVNLLSNIETSKAKKLVGAADDGSLQIPVSAYLIEGQGLRVLVDAGTGNALSVEAGKLPGILASQGIDPQSIEHILLTHLHPDHCYGLIYPDDTRVYPRAKIYIPAAEVAFWLDAELNDQTPQRFQPVMRWAKRALASYGDQIVRISGDGEVFPGISSLLCAGHSPGHTAWKISSNGKSVLAWGDIAHMPAIQVPYPEVGIIYDFDGAKAEAARLEIFRIVASEDAIIGAAHLPTFCRMRKIGDRYTLVPVSN